METKTIPKSIIAGIQSVMPVKITKHGLVRSISVENPTEAGIFKRTLNIVMYYKEEGYEKGWLVAGWIRESLARAMAEQPMLSGRLRPRVEDVGLEVVANDAGARLVEAKFAASLSEFLEMAKRNQRRAEAEIVFWRDIDEVDPQFSPLFYVQVTNFQSGGYSIGLSCSILIADLLLETDFLTKWTQIHNSLAHSQTTLKPMFHLPSLKQIHRDLPLRFHKSAPVLEFPKSASVLDGAEPVTFQAKTCLKMPLDSMINAVIAHGKSSADLFLIDGGENSGSNGMVVKIHPISDSCECDCDLEKTHVGVVNVSLPFGETLECTSCWFGSILKGVVFVVPSTFVDNNKPLATFIVALPHE